MFPLAGSCLAWLRWPARISPPIPPMHLRRVKPALQLHAPRVCCVYIRLIPNTRKCLNPSYLPNAFCRHHPIVPATAISTTHSILCAGRGNRARTCDLRFWRPPLYQLSYTPNAAASFHKACGVSSADSTFSRMFFTSIVRGVASTVLARNQPHDQPPDMDRIFGVHTPEFQSGRGINTSAYRSLRTTERAAKAALSES